MNKRVKKCFICCLVLSLFFTSFPQLLVYAENTEQPVQSKVSEEVEYVTFVEDETNELGMSEEKVVSVEEIAPYVILADGETLPQIKTDEVSVLSDDVVQLDTEDALYQYLKEQVVALSAQDEEMPQMIGHSVPMREVFDTIRKLSDTDANILILGENGTGKDLVARSLRYFSPRRECPFITIDLGSIPESLFESELFGYEKGAFTDARKAKAGRMEVASGGTLFLDEIGNLSLPMQAKLLTAIEKRQISRLGATDIIPIDVRLISATNVNIRELVEEGNFRQDLLYRINTIEITIPPLRERGEDVLLLADYFLQRYTHKYKKEINGLSREAKQKLMRYHWPGNVRELQHAIERAIILSDSPLLKPANFMLQPQPEKRVNTDEILNLEQLERNAIERAMKRSEGNLSRAAEYLGITRYALYRKLEKLGL